MEQSYQAELTLARQHLRTGRPADAERICPEILGQTPGHYDIAYRNLASVGKFQEYDEDIRTMERLFNDPDAGESLRTEPGFALGKAFEDPGNHTQAFRYWTKPNRAQRAGSNYVLRDHIIRPS